MKSQNQISRALVIGSCGEVGKLISRSLQASGVHVSGVDLKRCESISFGQFFEEDVAFPSVALQSQLATAESVFVCLPEEPGLKTAPLLASTLPSGALWVDSFSVKQPIAAVLESHRERLQILSINPMFSPSLGWQGKPVAAIELAAGDKVRSFKNILLAWGALVEILSAVEHDRATAAIQVATHAAAIAFGSTLLGLGYDSSRAIHLATPPHKLILALLWRIVSQNPEVYWEIQRDHPMGHTVRKSLAEGVQRLEQAVSSNSKNDFFLEFDKIAGTLRPSQDEIAEWTRKLLQQLLT